VDKTQIRLKIELAKYFLEFKFFKDCKDLILDALKNSVEFFKIKKNDRELDDYNEHTFDREQAKLVSEIYLILAKVQRFDKDDVKHYHKVAFGIL
jgi:hypothetical protein